MALELLHLVAEEVVATKPLVMRDILLTINLHQIAELPVLKVGYLCQTAVLEGKLAVNV